MALVSASIPNLINGVSQQPPSLRLNTQAQEQENGLSTVVDGLKKRPSSEHLAVLANVPSSVDNAFIHTIRRDDTEFYTLIITAGALNVYDKTGTQISTSSIPSTAINYLSGITDPASQITATTIADFTFIVNKTKTVAKNTSDLSAARPKEALFYVKQGDYSTDFTIRVTYNGTTYTATKTTLDSANASNQSDVRTNNIASALNNRLSLPAGFTKELLDNTLYIKRDDGNDFEVEATDSRGDTFLFAFKGQCGDYKKLPIKGKEGFLIQITGDNQKGQDDYYVQLSDPDGNGQLVWKEVIAPSIAKKFDETTMPHQLIRTAGGAFEFKPTTWDERGAGDDETNPFPSFIDYKINDIFFHKNRLGFLSDENVIMSEAGSFFNFFQRTVITLVYSGPLDVAVSNNQVSILKHAVPFAERLLLFSDLTQFSLVSDDILAPDTVSIDVSTQFEASLRSKPVGAGKYVFFATNKGAASGVREYFVDLNADTNDAAEITAHVPSYIRGEVTKLAASSNEDTLLVLSDSDRTCIYVYRYYWNNQEKLQSAWSKWKFNGTVLNVDFNKSEIFLIVKRGSDVCLETINLGEDTAISVTDAQHPVLLDRRVKLKTGGITSLPYTDSSAIYVTQNGDIVAVSEVAALLAAGKTVYAGINYTFKYTFSEQIIKKDNTPITTGRLQLRTFNLIFNDSGFFKTKVTPSRRSTTTQTFTGRSLGSTANVLGKSSIDSGTFSFPVLARSSNVDIELESDSFLPCVFQSAEWEGFYMLRSKRL